MKTEKISMIKIAKEFKKGPQKIEDLSHRYTL